MLRQLIKDTRYKKVRIGQEIDTLTSHLNEVLTDEQMTHVQQWCSTAASKVADATKTNQIKKFNELRARRFGPRLETDKVVKNMSKRLLTEDEKEVLTLGLNYAVTPRAIPTTDIIAATETTARQLPSEAADKLRSGVSATLQSAKPPRSNLSGQQGTSARTRL